MHLRVQMEERASNSRLLSRAITVAIYSMTVALEVYLIILLHLRVQAENSVGVAGFVKDIRHSRIGK